VATIVLIFSGRLCLSANFDNGLSGIVVVDKAPPFRSRQRARWRVPRCILARRPYSPRAAARIFAPSMACINVTGVQVLDNPASFKNPLQFEISFECLAAISDGARRLLALRPTRARARARTSLSARARSRAVPRRRNSPARRAADIEWKVTYVGSAESEEFDQELDSVLVGPINVGSYKIVVQVRRAARAAHASTSPWRRPAPCASLRPPAHARYAPSPAVHTPRVQADAPDPSKIPPEDLLGVTVVILSCLYKEKEFVRIGYYVSNEYDDPELRDNPPDVVELERVVRNVLHDKPRVTKYEVPWDEPEPERPRECVHAHEEAPMT